MSTAPPTLPAENPESAGSGSGSGSTDVVAFLGPKASFTHQATLQRFPSTSSTLLPQSSIEACFAAIQSRTATFSVVPFENSSNGSVVFTLDLFADNAQQYPDVLVAGEIYLPVQHCLVGRRPATAATTDSSPSAQHPPPSTLTHIKKIYSHPQAWGQCKRFLSSHLAGVERQDVSSTSRGAEIVAAEDQQQKQPYLHPRDPPITITLSSAPSPHPHETSSPTPSSHATAAISSSLAAQLYNLDILASGIEDHPGTNSTRFFILRHTHPSSAPSPSPPLSLPSPTKSLLTFTVEHTQPGALAACLAVFQQHALNLTSINSRPSGERAWHYVFVVEFSGRPGGAMGGLGEEEGRAALMRDLESVARRCRWLGSWESRLVGP